MLEKRGKEWLALLLGVCDKSTRAWCLYAVPSPATWCPGSRCSGRHSAPSGHCKASVLPGATFSQEVTRVLAKHAACFLFLCGPPGTNVFHLDYVMNFIWNNEALSTFCVSSLFHITCLVAPRTLPHGKQIPFTFNKRVASVRFSWENKNVHLFVLLYWSTSFRLSDFLASRFLLYLNAIINKNSVANGFENNMCAFNYHLCFYGLSDLAGLW